METSLIYNRTLLVCLQGMLLIALASGCGSDDDIGGIPSNGSYNIIISGQASFSGVPGLAFQQVGAMVVTPTVAAPVFNNGTNPVDIGIFTNVSPIIGAAGAIYFGTNTSLSSLVGSNLAASAIDIAFVQVSQAGRIEIAVDGNAFGLPSSRLGTFNIYNLTSGVTAQIHNVLAGNIVINFNGNQVTGTINLGGSSGFAGPNITSEYRANFSGTRAN